jgi:hypothetical protein
VTWRLIYTLQGGEGQIRVSPENRKTGKPENRKTGKPENRKTGKPENRKTGKPENRKTGKPENRIGFACETAPLDRLA